ncbi:uncharacterized protein BT62DRAFT_1012381 [Guyanagaster necrorhizus]|uniref:Uncharacterized protein n=1 Tax=Guyanagaster necrorhizus TaxID=856835 RepID=A0A9P7VHS4_9AGAR|nr:uncharacterized protein BT62DRAFT_1012381 [Guyanagaster necrorhizus MCA 3950]KAG7440787.1 hypothetical protein BT62DRAFT_1012381 [Guyanagaster necrorhizus MCA 3950]
MTLNDSRLPGLRLVISPSVIHTKEAAPRYTYRSYGYAGDVYDSNKDEKVCITAGFFGLSLRPGLKNFHLARTTQVMAYPGNTLTFDSNTGTYIETNVMGAFQRYQCDVNQCIVSVLPGPFSI